MNNQIIKIHLIIRKLSGEVEVANTISKPGEAYELPLASGLKGVFAEICE